MLCKVSLQDAPQKPAASKGPMSLHFFRGEPKKPVKAIYVWAIYFWGRKFHSIYNLLVFGAHLVGFIRVKRVFRPSRLGFFRRVKGFCNPWELHILLGQVLSYYKMGPSCVRFLAPTVDGRNPANQLRLVVYPTIYKVLAPSQMVSRISEPSTV